MTLEIVFLN